jgi:hypothetical protein
MGLKVCVCAWRLFGDLTANGKTLKRNALRMGTRLSDLQVSEKLHELRGNFAFLQRTPASFVEDVEWVPQRSRTALQHLLNNLTNV